MEPADPGYRVDARWIGWSTVGFALVYAGVAGFWIWVMYTAERLGIAGLAVLAFAGLGSLAFAVFAGTGVSVLVNGDDARSGARIAHVLGVVGSLGIHKVGIPLAIAHGLVAWLAHWKEDAREPQACPAGAPSGAPSAPAARSESRHGDECGEDRSSFADLPVWLAVVVAGLAGAAVLSLLGGLSTVAMGAAFGEPMVLAIAGVELFAAVAMGGLGWWLWTWGG